MSRLFVAAIAVICALTLVVWYFLNPPISITIKDAYIDNQGQFVFTLQNNGSSGIALTYKWHLDDPKTNKPVYSGEGSVTIPAGSCVKVVETFSPKSGYDCRFFVMNVEVFKDGVKIASYREQKSPYDWDYSVVPPVPKR